MTKPGKHEDTWEGLSYAKALRDCFTCGVILIDDTLKPAVLSDRARHLLRLAPDAASRPAFQDLPAPLQSMARAGLASGKAQADGHIELQGASGEKIGLHVSAIPLRCGGKDPAVVLVVNDLAPTRQLEENLDQLDRLANIGTLAAAMAHEIKNALVPGKTFIDLLLEKHQDAELVDVVRRELARVDAIVSRMLKFAGPTRPVFSRVRLHKVLDNSLRLVQPQLEEKLISLQQSLHAASDVVQGDDGQLQQAFVNLFLNALEAMEPNGTLSVRTESVSPSANPSSAENSADQAQLRVAIKDSGAGIPAESLPQLFEPFFTTKPNGTGLGLPITRRIILQHHGTISVESQPGQGTEFQILLPAAA